MKDVTKRTIGELIDMLVTADIRTWFAQDEIMNPDNDLETVANNARIAQRGNVERNKLIGAINEYFGDDVPEEKSYDNKDS